MKPYFTLRNFTDKQGLNQVYLIYSHKGNIIKLPMSVKVPPDGWNEEKQRVYPSVKDFGLSQTEINNELDSCETKIRNIITDYRHKEGLTTNPDVEYVKTEFYKNDAIKNKEENLLECYREYAKMKENSGMISYKRIRSLIKDLDYFLGDQSKRVYLKNVDYKFLEDFRSSMLNREIIRKKGPNIKGQCNITVKKKIGVFKSFLKNMEQKRKYVNQSYKTFDDGLSETRSDLILLTNEEVEFLYNMDLSKKPYLERIRDKYLISCYTGLRFNDLYSITKGCIVEKKLLDGSIAKTLHIRASKTKKYVDPPLIPKCESILDRNEWKLPKISSQKANEYLRELLKETKLDSLKIEYTKYRDNIHLEKKQKMKYEFIHFHTSRAYFITNALRRGVPINIIMGWSGHSGSFSVFIRYVETHEGNEDFIKKMY